MSNEEGILRSSFELRNSIFELPRTITLRMSRPLLAAVALLLAACATTSGPPTEPNDREWGLLATDYASIESMRKAQAPVPPGASRKQMIEITLANLQKIEPS